MLSKAIHRETGRHYEANLDDTWIHDGQRLVDVFPRGGGFVRGVPVEALEIVEAWPNETWAVSEFGIDEGPTFPGIHMPHRRWNGWAVPMFDRATVDRIIEWLEDEGGQMTLRWSDEDPGLLLEEDVANEFGPCSMVGVEVDGVAYWPVGDGWCWDEAE